MVRLRTGLQTSKGSGTSIAFSVSAGCPYRRMIMFFRIMLND